MNSTDGQPTEASWENRCETCGQMRGYHLHHPKRKDGHRFEGPVLPFREDEFEWFREDERYSYRLGRASDSEAPAAENPPFTYTGPSMEDACESCGAKRIDHIKQGAVGHSFVGRTLVISHEDAQLYSADECGRMKVGYMMPPAEDDTAVAYDAAWLCPYHQSRCQWSCEGPDACALKRRQRAYIASHTVRPQVDHPDHYGGDTTYEAIKVIDAWGLDFHLGNAVKYIRRAGRKDPAAEIEDLEKAEFYLKRKIDLLKGKGKGHGV